MDHTEVQIRIRGLFKPLRQNPLPFMGGDVPGFAQLQPRDKGMPHRAELLSSLPPEEESGVTIWLDVSTNENVLHLPVVTLF